MVERLPGKYKTLGFGPQLQGSWVVVCVWGGGLKVI